MSTAMKTQPDALARVYAGALFETADGAGGQSAVESTLAELEDILELARENTAFGEFLSSQILSAPERSASLAAIFGAVEVLLLSNPSEAVRRQLEVVMEQADRISAVVDGIRGGGPPEPVTSAEPTR